TQPLRAEQVNGRANKLPLHLGRVIGSSLHCQSSVLPRQLPSELSGADAVRLVDFDSLPGFRADRSRCEDLFHRCPSRFQSIPIVTAVAISRTRRAPACTIFSPRLRARLKPLI